MRAFVAMFAMFPLFAASQDLGTYSVTSGNLLAEGPGSFSGNGFSGTLAGYPAPLLGNGYTGVGEADFSMAFSPPVGRDNGVYMSVTGPANLTSAGLVPVNYLFLPYIQESGELTTHLIDITGGGIYTTSFHMSVDVAYGAPHSTTPEGYADFVGHGTVTVDVAPPTCSNGVCGPLQISSVDYSFAAPELDPAAISSAFIILGGSLLVLRGRRSRAG